MIDFFLNQLSFISYLLLSHGYTKYAYRFDLNPKSSDFGFFILKIPAKMAQ